MINLHVSDLLLSRFKAKLSQHMIQSLLNSPSTKQTIASLFGKFPAAPLQSQCHGSQVCHCAYSALQNKVLLDLFEIYFAAALSNSGDTTDVFIMKSFLERATISLDSHRCTFAQSETCTYRKSFDLRNRQAFTATRQPIRDWRAAITELQVQNAETSHSTMMKKVEDICFDLERRCYDIEAPVRSAEEERDRQKGQAEQLRRQIENLTGQLNNSTQAISTLQQDLARLKEHAGGASARAEELSEALEVARQELRNQQHRSDDELQEEQERARSRELELIATCTEKDDRLEELQETLCQLELRNEHLQELARTSSQERATSAGTTAALRQEIAEVKELLEANKTLCCQKEEEVKRLLAGNTDLQIELENVQNRVRRPYFPRDTLCLLSSATSAGLLVTNFKVNR